MPEITSALETEGTVADTPRVREAVRWLALCEQDLRAAERARAAAAEAACRTIGDEYASGRIPLDTLVDLYHHLRSTMSRGLGPNWAAHVPVSPNAIASRARLRALEVKNGPHGLSWVGAFPIGLDDPRPPVGVPVVYVLYRSTEPVYVGSTQHLQNRLSTHRREGKTFTSWMAYPCADREEAYRLEERLLRTVKPPMNERTGR